MKTKRNLFNNIKFIDSFFFLINGGALLIGCGEKVVPEIPEQNYTLQTTGAYTCAKVENSEGVDVTRWGYFQYIKVGENSAKFGAYINNNGIDTNFYQMDNLIYIRDGNILRVNLVFSGNTMPLELTIFADRTISFVFAAFTYTYAWHKDFDLLNGSSEVKYNEIYAHKSDHQIDETLNVSWVLKNDNTVIYTMAYKDTPNDKTSITCNYEIYGNMMVVRDTIRNEVYYGYVLQNDTYFILTGSFYQYSTTDNYDTSFMYILEKQY